MAVTRKTVRALIFESTTKNDAFLKTETNGKIIPRELKFVDTVTRICRDSSELENKFTKVSNQRQSNFMTMSGERMKPPVKMLVYEDSSDEEDEGNELRTTPPIPQERQSATPGAPIKSRKEFDKKVLRPKKLVYHSDRETEENYFYARTPTKKLGRSDEGNVYKNLTEIITMPRKVLHLPTDEELYLSTNRQIIFNSGWEGRKKSRNRNLTDETRRTGKSKNSVINDDKENNSTVIGMEYNRDVRQPSDSHKSRSFLKSYDRGGTCAESREEFINLPKPEEFTHFRI